MRFKLGSRIIITGEHTDDFQGAKGIIVSKEVFLNHRLGATIFANHVLIKLDKKINGHHYCQASSDICSLHLQVNYNE